MARSSRIRSSVPAIVDRLLGNAALVNIRGRSYRMRSYQETAAEKGAAAIMP